VFRYLRRATCPAWHLRGSRRSRLDGYREWIDARIAEGSVNVAALHRQLTERGFRGSYGSVYAFVTKRLGAAGKKRDRRNAAEPPTPAPPSARQLSFEWARRAEKRKPPEQARLDAIRAPGDELTAALDLADAFADLIRKRSAGTLSGWLTRGEAASDPDLRRFAEGIRRDEAAVQAAVTETWSNGPVEGHVNRLKMIKRQMYGRAGFALLRARVLTAA
jgi:transposase